MSRMFKYLAGGTNAGRKQSIPLFTAFKRTNQQSYLQHVLRAMSPSNVVFRCGTSATADSLLYLPHPITYYLENTPKRLPSRYAGIDSLSDWAGPKLLQETAVSNSPSSVGPALRARQVGQLLQHLINPPFIPNMLVPASQPSFIAIGAILLVPAHPCLLVLGRCLASIRLLQLFPAHRAPTTLSGWVTLTRRTVNVFRERLAPNQLDGVIPVT